VGGWVGLSVYCFPFLFIFLPRKTTGHQDSPGEGNLAHFSKGISAGADRSRAGDVHGHLIVFFSHTNQPAILFYEPANRTGCEQKSECLM